MVLQVMRADILLVGYFFSEPRTSEKIKRPAMRVSEQNVREYYNPQIPSNKRFIIPLRYFPVIFTVLFNDLFQTYMQKCNMCCLVLLKMT